jgi:GDP-L-fucose synthase
LENMQIQNNLIQVAHINTIEKLVFIGSSCIYPKLAPQPLKEEYLLKGPLEPTNEGYAIAKIAGVKLCEHIRKQYHKDFVSLMPTNLYGPNDNFDLKSSHVLLAMMRKFHEAKLNDNAPVTLWGSGTRMREFLRVDDLSKAVVFAIENKLPEHLYNVGTGTDITIKQLAETIQKIVGHTGIIDWDSAKPDGAPRKLMDVSKINTIGWKAKIDLQNGIEDTDKGFCENIENIKEVKWI